MKIVGVADAKWRSLRSRIRPGSQRASVPLQDDGARPLLPWPASAALSGVAAAFLGWLIMAGLSLVAWLSTPTIELPAVFRFTSEFWLLANGVPIDVGAIRISLTPLGFSFAGVVGCRWLARFGAHQAGLARPALNRLQLAWRVWVCTVGGYLLSLAGLALGSGQVAHLGRGLVGGLLLAGVGVAWACLREFRLWGDDALPALVVQAFRGAGVALAGLAAAGAVLVVVAAIAGWSRIETLEDGLALDGYGSAVWGLLVLAYLPNLLAWAVSWILGAGFSVGGGSLVTVSGTQLGMLPDIPIFGALPAPGLAPEALAAVLIVGVVAGAGGAVVACLGMHGAPLWLRILTGAASGVVAAGVLLAVAAVSGGDIGTLRMTGLGPAMGDLLIVGPALLILSAALPGAAWALIPAPNPAPAAATGSQPIG